MAIVCILLGIGLAVVAWRTREDSERLLPIFFLACAILNFGGAAHMITTNFDYAFKLAPNEHNR